MEFSSNKADNYYSIFVLLFHFIIQNCWQNSGFWHLVPLDFPDPVLSWFFCCISNNSFTYPLSWHHISNFLKVFSKAVVFLPSPSSNQIFFWCNFIIKHRFSYRPCTANCHIHLFIPNLSPIQTEISCCLLETSSQIPNHPLLLRMGLKRISSIFPPLPVVHTIFLITVHILHVIQVHKHV